jgi:hypothetical protein
MLVIVIIFLFSFVIISSEDTNTLDLTQGKNNIMLNITSPKNVKDFIRLNPSIEVISFKEENKTIGYVNIFNGIGENFVIQKNVEYEIIVKQNVSLILPS